MYVWYINISLYIYVYEGDLITCPIVLIVSMSALILFPPGVRWFPKHLCSPALLKHIKYASLGRHQFDLIFGGPQASLEIKPNFGPGGDGTGFGPHVEYDSLGHHITKCRFWPSLYIRMFWPLPAITTVVMSYLCRCPKLSYLWWWPESSYFIWDRKPFPWYPKYTEPNRIPRMFWAITYIVEQDFVTKVITYVRSLGW